MNTTKPKKDDTNFEFEAIKQANPIVYKILKSGGTLEDCIVALVKSNLELKRIIFELEAIAPRKLILPDGTIMIANCPDHLVPITKL